MNPLENRLNSEGERLLSDWRNRFPEAAKNPGIEIAVRRWLTAGITAEEAEDIAYQATDWYSNRTLPVPNLFDAIAKFGYAELIVQDWTELPLEPYLDEKAREHWRRRDLEPTFKEFREENLSTFSGGTLELMGRDPELFCTVIYDQVQAKLTELKRLAALPYQDITPEPYDFDADYEEADENWKEQKAKFNEPFVIRQQLTCFARGFELMRMDVLDHNPELGLPNLDLLNESVVVDLGEILRTFEEVDPKLKAILRHLAKHDYFALDDPEAPDSFWWRHWKRESKKHAGQQRHTRPSGHKPKRGERR